MDKAGILLSVFMAGITLWMVRKYLNSLLQSKETFRVLNVALWLTYYIYQLFLEMGGTGTIVPVFLNIVLIFCICHISYDGAVHTKALYAVLLCVMWSILEMVAFYLLQIILPIESPAFHRFGSVLTKVFLIIMVSVIVNRFQEAGKKELSKKYAGMLLAISISGMVIAHNIFWIDSNGKNVLPMISMVMLLFINGMIFEIYQKLYKNMERERDYDILAQQLLLISQHEKEQEQYRRKQREMHHDLVNICLGLKSNIREGQLHNAIAAIDELLGQEVNPTGAVSNCGNLLIDSLINHKYEIAKKCNVKFELHVQIPPKLSVSYADLAVVLGNLIDNAIEAASKCAKEKRVAIFIEMKQRQLIIVVQNTYAVEPKQDKNGNFLTTKKNPKEHGFGIRAIKRLIHKYDGSSVFQVKDNIFEAIVLMNLSDEPKNDSF